MANASQVNAATNPRIGTSAIGQLKKNASPVIGGQNQITWVQVGATIDNTAGQPSFSDHGGMSFAELLQAGANRGLHPTLTEVLGEKSGQYGMPMETEVLVKMPGAPDSSAQVMWKNDVGSGQRGDPHYKVDLHAGIARKIGWSPNQDIMVANASQAKGALIGGKVSGGAIQSGVNAVGNAVGSAADALSSVAAAASFLFSLQFLYVLGGFALLLMALVLIAGKSGGSGGGGGAGTIVKAAARVAE